MTKLHQRDLTVKCLVKARIILLSTLAFALTFPILVSEQNIKADSSTNSVAKPPRPVRIPQQLSASIRQWEPGKAVLSGCGRRSTFAPVSYIPAPTTRPPMYYFGGGSNFTCIGPSCFQETLSCPSGWTATPTSPCCARCCQGETCGPADCCSPRKGPGEILP
jgi:hypothetical protein